MNKSKKINIISDLMSPAARALLIANGSDLVRQIGMDVVRGVVLDIFLGRNLRDSTEMLTRRRIAALNLATLELFLKGSTITDDFMEKLPVLATEVLSQKRIPKAERWIGQWLLGLTDKAFQNVLRDDRNALVNYRDRYVNACKEVITAHQNEKGLLEGEIQIGSKVRAQINWLWVTYLLNTIGAQTLAIRGSEKSAYGKLFEKLVMGSLLTILGFKHVLPPPSEFNKVFWLASRNERRESDATLLYQLGQGVRFDIGFIGRGNPEISLDKVSRFERQISLGDSTYFMATIILVDRIGNDSRIEQLADEIQGTIVQMSAGYWPQHVAKVLNKSLGFTHDLVNMHQSRIDAYLTKAIKTVPLEDFIGLSDKFKANKIKEEEARYEF